MLSIEHMSTMYGHKKGIQDISFSIDEGKILGIYGLRGSGKTTLLKSILQILPNSTGDALWNGFDIRDSLKDIAYVSQQPCSVGSMKPMAYGKFLRQFYPNFKVNQFKKILAEFKIPLQINMKKLTKEQQCKVELASAFSQGASLLLLDEAFSIFPKASKEDDVRRLLTYLQSNETIVVTTTSLQDMEMVLDEIMYLKDGELALKGDILIEEETIQDSVIQEDNIQQDNKKEYHFTMSNDEMFDESGDDDESM